MMVVLNHYFGKQECGNTVHCGVLQAHCLQGYNKHSARYQRTPAMQYAILGTIRRRRLAGPRFPPNLTSHIP